MIHTDTTRVSTCTERVSHTGCYFNASLATLGSQLFPIFILYFSTSLWFRSTSTINLVRTVNITRYKILLWRLIYRRFRRFSKKTRGFVISVSPPVCLHGKKIQFPLEEFSWNFIFDDFSKFSLEKSNFITIRQEERVLYEKSCADLW